MNSGTNLTPLEFRNLGGWVPIYMNIKCASLYINVVRFLSVKMFHWDFKSLLDSQSGS